MSTCGSLNKRYCHMSLSQKQVQHQLAPLRQRRTASSSISCLIWAAPGSKPLVMRPRHRELWRRCVLKVPSPSPSPCMSRVGPMAQSGQSHNKRPRVTRFTPHECIWPDAMVDNSFALRYDITPLQDHGPGFRNRDRLFSHLQSSVLCSWTGGFSGKWLFFIYWELPERRGFSDSRLLLPNQGGSKFQQKKSFWMDSISNFVTPNTVPLFFLL